MSEDKTFWAKIQEPNRKLSKISNQYPPDYVGDHYFPVDRNPESTMTFVNKSTGKRDCDDEKVFI